jgi:hypothetical protein
MTDDEIDTAARYMLTEIIVRRVKPGSDQWYRILASRYPATKLTDRDYITMRAAELIEERRQGQ